MTSAYSTICDNVSLLLVDTSVITTNNPYIAYVSSVSIPGRIATIRDATGYLSSPNQRIIISSTKDVFFNLSTSSIFITQPFGFVSLISRDKNTLNVINNYAFPAPTTAHVSSVYINDTAYANSYFASQYVSTPYVNTSNISSYNIVASNAISTNTLNANTILTNNLQATNILLSTGIITNLSNINAYITFLSSANILVNSISSLSLQTNSISTNSITTNSISTPNIFTTSISTTNLRASNISTNILFAPSISTINLQASNILTNSITTTGISTNNILTNSISTTNIQATSISTNLIFTNIISTNSITTTSISTTNLRATNISTNLLLAPSISTINLQASNILTNSITISGISTNNILTNSISTINLQTSNILTINLQASNISTNSISTTNLQANTISTNFLYSKFASSLQMETSSILLNTISNASKIFMKGTTDIPSILTMTDNSLGSSGTIEFKFNYFYISPALTTSNLQSENLTTDTIRPAGDYIKYTNGAGIDMCNTDILNVNNLGLGLINGVSIGDYNNAYWSVFPATQPLNMSNYNITNVTQTNNPTDAATNGIITKYLINNIGTTSFSVFTQIQPTPPATVGYFPNTPFNKFKVTFTLVGTNVASPLQLYFQLSNATRPSITSGLMINSSFPYQAEQNTITNKNHSLTYTDIYDLSSWVNGDIYYPLLNIRSSGATVNFTSGSILVVLEPTIQ